MRSAVIALQVALLTAATSGAAFASTQPSPPEPRGDNSGWVAVVAVLVFAAVVGGLLFLANAYRKHDEQR